MNKVEYKPLTLAQLRWNADTLTENYGELVAQPLEPGFGTTLGNAIRRVLLGSIEGSAVTSVIIKSGENEFVNNEFSVIKGIKHDGMQLILNIKGIVIKNLTGKPGKMHLKAKGEQVVTVGHIEADSHLQLVNKDHVIATLANDGELEIEFFVELGRGYVPAQWPHGKMLQDDNKIYLDAMFSPVVKVYFDVEKTRVGKDIDYDKLTFRVYTNGAEDPKCVMHYAVSVLRTQLEHFLSAPEIPFNELSKVPTSDSSRENEVSSDLGLHGVSIDLLLQPVDELELSARAHNCLISAGKKRIVDLINMSEEEVLKLKNFGRKSLREVKDSLKKCNLSLGMNISEEDIKQALKK